MRMWIVVAVAVLVGVLAFTVPIRSQEQTRVGAVIDVTALTTRLDAMKPAMGELKKQNEELQKMQKSLKETNDTLAIIAAGVGVIREPIRWEYRFIRRSTEKTANQVGDEGWELVSIYEEKDWFVYRRPLPPKKKGPALPD